MQQATRGAQDKYIVHSIEFSETTKVHTKHGLLEPRVPFNNNHLAPGDSFLFPYLQTALPKLDLNSNVQSWIEEKEESEKFMDCFTLLAGGVLNRRKSEIGLLFESSSEGLASLVGNNWSSELRQVNPRARNASNLSGYNTTVTAPVRFQTTSPWLDFESDCLLRDYYDKIVSTNSEGKIVQNIPWDTVEQFLNGQDGSAPAMMNLLYTAVGQLHRESRNSAPHTLEIQLWRFVRHKDRSENTTSMERLASLINEAWGSSHKFDICFQTKQTNDVPYLRLQGVEAISEYLDWIGSCVIPGEQHKFIVGENGLP